MAEKLEGWLRKRGEKGGLVGKQWKVRYFVLNGNELEYSEGLPPSKILGKIDLLQVTGIKIDNSAINARLISQGHRGFNIEVPNRVYYLDASSETELQQWVTALNAVIANLKAGATGIPAPAPSPQPRPSTTTVPIRKHTALGPPVTPTLGTSPGRAQAPLPANSLPREEMKIPPRREIPEEVPEVLQPASLEKPEPIIKVDPPIERLPQELRSPEPELAISPPKEEKPAPIPEVATGGPPPRPKSVMIERPLVLTDTHNPRKTFTEEPKETLRVPVSHEITTDSSSQSENSTSNSTSVSPVPPRTEPAVIDLSPEQPKKINPLTMAGAYPSKVTIDAIKPSVEITQSAPTPLTTPTPTPTLTPTPSPTPELAKPPIPISQPPPITRERSVVGGLPPGRPPKGALAQSAMTVMTRPQLQQQDSSSQQSTELIRSLRQEIQEFTSRAIAAESEVAKYKGITEAQMEVNKRQVEEIESLKKRIQSLEKQQNAFSFLEKTTKDSEVTVTEMIQLRANLIRQLGEIQTVGLGNAQTVHNLRTLRQENTALKSSLETLKQSNQRLEEQNKELELRVNQYFKI